MGKYFRGWYYKCQSKTQTLAVIPSFHKTLQGVFCSVQIITDSASYQVQFPCCKYEKENDGIRIGKNHFHPQWIKLDLSVPDGKIYGLLHFSDWTPIQYDIMGPFRFVPFLQCRHSVYSMKHFVNGDVWINDTCFRFQNAVGYMEGDRGYSFPKQYLWTQCSYDNGSLMLSVAKVPFLGTSFTGIIGIVFVNGREYRLATYLGARLEKADKEEIILRQGKYRLTLHPKAYSGQSLRAPVKGDMTRTIYEHLSCPMDYRFEKDGLTILELSSQNAAFEYEF